MEDILKDINAVAGVTGSFVCNGEGQVLASALPELFDETILSAVGRTLAQTMVGPATARRREIGDIDLVYDQGRLIAKNLGEGCLCILCVRHINVPLLNLTANVAAKKLGEMVTALQKAMTGGPVMTAAISLEDERRRQLWRRVPVWVWAAIGGAILLVTVITGAALPVSPTAGSQLPAVLSPTSTPVPTTPTLTPTAAVAATQTALAGLAADVMATALPRASAAVGTSIPTPTDTPTPTQTPVPPTATATDTPRPTATLTPTATASDTPRPTATPIPTPTITPRPTGPIALTIYLRDTRTEAGFAALSGDQVNGGMVYEEGQYVYGDAAMQIGETTYHFDKSGVEEQLPDPWRVEFEFDELLVACTGNQAGFNPKQAQFWVGILDDSSAMGEDNPYSLTMRLYEGNELRRSIQVFFTVADVAEAGGDGEEVFDKSLPYRP